MPDPRRERAIAILKEILGSRGDNRVTTTSLLYKCQEAALLLELPDHECKWMNLELVGYPPWDYEEATKQHAITIPFYRCFSLDAVVEMPTSVGFGFTIGIDKMRTVVRFFVSHPIGVLEECHEPISLSCSVLLGGPPEPGDREKRKSRATACGLLSAERARGIAFAVRAVVSEFAVRHHTALVFERSTETIVGSIRHELAEFLSRLDRPLLGLLEETVRKQESSSDPVQLRIVTENHRSILRRFTSLVLHDDMIPEGEARPEDKETTKKTRMITRWIRTRMAGRYDTEADRLEENVEFLETQQETLIDVINKQGHGDMGAVTEGEVDRTLIATILWMTELAAALERAGFK